MSPHTTTSREVQTLQIEQTVDIAASPETVFRALTTDIASWWGPPYCDENDVVDIVLDLRLGGLMYESYGAAQGWVWGTVVGFETNKWLEIDGPMGLQGTVKGNLKYTLEPAGKGTRLILSHTAMGLFGPEAEEMYAGGWADLLGARLKAFVEKGEVMGLRAHLASKKKQI